MRFSSSEVLLITCRIPGVILRLFDPVADGAEGFFQEPSRFFAIGALEPHGVDLDAAIRRYDDFDG